VYISFLDPERLEVMKYSFLEKNMYMQGKEWNKNSKADILKYAVGPLMYTPANHKTIADKIINEWNDKIKSIAFCLEDSILEDEVEHAEDVLAKSLDKISNALKNKKITIDELPLIFIRVRNPIEMIKVFYKIGNYADIITGIIWPKFSLKNVEDYVSNYRICSNNIKKFLYVMPILEDKGVLDIFTRRKNLYGIKEQIDKIKEYILNIRIGGNDFCNYYGFRRSVDQTIYDIGVIRDVMSDIINTFGRDYVVSSVVYEWFEDSEGNDTRWINGLKKEIELDKLNGFVGKTLIHPSQIDILQESMAVDYNDYIDAKSIIEWESDVLGVAKSRASKRMNEVKVHRNWAKRIMTLAYVYGVKEESKDFVS